MSQKPTLEALMLRCTEDADCMLWTGSVSQSGAPTTTYRNEDGRKPTKQVRRLVWEERHGPIPAGMVVAVSCENPQCLEHLELVTRAEVNARQWKRQDYRAKRTESLKRTSRARGKLDMDKAREVRASSETLVVVSARLGISITTASLIRRGLAWKEACNPFAGLGG